MPAEAYRQVTNEYLVPTPAQSIHKINVHRMMVGALARFQ